MPPIFLEISYIGQLWFDLRIVAPDQKMLGIKLGASGTASAAQRSAEKGGGGRRKHISPGEAKRNPRRVVVLLLTAGLFLGTNWKMFSHVLITN